MGDRILRIGRGEHAVDDESLVGDAQRGELGAGARGFRQRRRLGTSDENDGRHRWVSKRRKARAIQRELPLQTGERTQA